MNTRRLPLLYPTKICATLLFVLSAIWYASTSQNNSAAYLLLFFTVAIFLVSIPQTLLNLSGLTARVQSIKPAFAGEEVAVSIEVVNESARSRHACVVSLPELDEIGESIDHIGAGNAARVTLRFPTDLRGEYELAYVDLRSSYPVGFLASRKRAAARQSYIVYPAATGEARLPGCGANALGTSAPITNRDGDDYNGVRGYIPGESQRHIDWKAVARGQPLMTKQFTAETDDVLWLDFAAVSSADTELRLSQLALWVVEAERAHRRYGVRIPGTEIRVSSGDAHYHTCLRALALFR